MACTRAAPTPESAPLTQRRTACRCSRPTARAGAALCVRPHRRPSGGGSASQHGRRGPTTQGDCCIHSSHGEHRLHPDLGCCSLMRAAKLRSVRSPPISDWASFWAGSRALSPSRRRSSTRIGVRLRRELWLHRGGGPPLCVAVYHPTEVSALLAGIGAWSKGTTA